MLLLAAGRCAGRPLAGGRRARGPDRARARGRGHRPPDDPAGRHDGRPRPPGARRLRRPRALPGRPRAPPPGARAHPRRAPRPPRHVPDRGVRRPDGADGGLGPGQAPGVRGACAAHLGGARPSPGTRTLPACFSCVAPDPGGRRRPPWIRGGALGWDRPPDPLPPAASHAHLAARGNRRPRHAPRPRRRRPGPPARADPVQPEQRHDHLPDRRGRPGRAHLVLRGLPRQHGLPRGGRDPLAHEEGRRGPDDRRLRRRHPAGHLRRGDHLGLPGQRRDEEGPPQRLVPAERQRADDRVGAADRGRRDRGGARPGPARRQRLAAGHAARVPADRADHRDRGLALAGDGSPDPGLRPDQAELRRRRRPPRADRHQLPADGHEQRRLDARQLAQLRPGPRPGADLRALPRRDLGDRQVDDDRRGRGQHGRQVR